MKVVLVPGPRNEELIEKIREIKQKQDWDNLSIEGSSEMYDAMYYACECGSIMLEDQRRYLEWLLLEEESQYYEERMLSDLEHDQCMSEIKSALEQNECGAWEMTGLQKATCREHAVIFAIKRHEDGWNYYYIDSTSGYTCDGIWDDPEAKPYEIACSLFTDAGFFLTHLGKELDFEAVEVTYNEKAKLVS